MTRYVIGLDLGQAADFTALAVVGRQDDLRTDAQPKYSVGHLQRFPPGTPYREIATVILGLLKTESLTGASIVIDVTAVGGEVLDLFRKVDFPPDIESVVLTAGHHREPSPHGGWMLPKKDVVTSLQLLLQGRHLVIPRSLLDADLLIRELGNFRAKVSQSTDPSQIDWREGKDDDLVLAVALACWKAGRLQTQEPPFCTVLTPRRNPLYGPIYMPGEHWPWR